MADPYRNKETLALYQVRSELAQLMGWLKDGDAFGKWMTFDHLNDLGKMWIRDAEPIKPTLDEAAKCLPPGWIYKGTLFGASPDEPPNNLWTSFAAQTEKSPVTTATGETELIARFRLAVRAWKKHNEQDKDDKKNKFKS